MRLNSRAHTSALILFTAALACGPKSDGNEDGGDETGGSTSTGEALTDGASDPTAPTASSTAGTGVTAGTATTTSTSGEDPTATASATTVSTITATATSTSATSATDSGNETGGDPPPVIPCEREGVPLAGITTQIGYLQSQVPPRPDPTGTGGSSGGGELDPGTLLVKLSDQAFTCADPSAPLGCGQHWSVTIVIPPEFQAPGVFNLLGPNVTAGAFETGVGGGGDCSFGGGSFDATFEILAIDDKTVQARLCNVNSPFFATNPQLEGSFEAARCPQ